MAKQGMVLEVYEKLNKFRLHNVSTTKKAQKTGEGVREDICIVNKIEQFLPNIGKQRKAVRHGSFYKEIKRLKVSPIIKKELMLHLASSLKANPSDYYVERFNKGFSCLIPCLITRDKDRL
ncbi:hypothetical protein [Candidatus Bacteroides intestinigallinarum]|uniref:hypothetical protein n=1 Tax=Candidatus Bacteroides intestinigallinarum TaxID=2838470 RepID=UPI00216576DC|nr:hypothetical protein [Candidatus Bacteroides intestinigallinarum]MCS3201588.1 hypothetical protein [Candidatus Bacteroides intestinigallinarum]